MPVRSDDKHVLVLYTGGTIGMKKNPHGVLAPQENEFIRKVRDDVEMNSSKNRQQMELLHGQLRIIYKIEEYEPLLDSSNMSIENWIKIAKDVGNRYDGWDGFVILHGTDTLAYAASALSFMLKGTEKPVILTGAQISIFELGSDAKNNFLGALRCAASDQIKEVCVYFANKLLRGNRTIKHSSESVEAFSTPNYHPLAEICADIKVDTRVILKSEGCPNFFYGLNKNVVILRIFPTMSDDWLRCALKSPTEGVVLLSYGAGNIPNRDGVKRILNDAVKRGVIIVNLTQCMRGAVNSLYETGEILNELGIIPGYDMTQEAAFAKLAYVLGRDELNLAQKKQMMQRNLCGELTDNN